MMRTMLSILCLALASMASGDQRSEELLMVGSALADIISTEIALAQHGIDEANPLLRHQGARIATKAAVTAGLIIAARKLEANGRRDIAKWLRWPAIVVWAGASGWNVAVTVAVK